MPNKPWQVRLIGPEAQLRIRKRLFEGHSVDGEKQQEATVQSERGGSSRPGAVIDFQTCNDRDLSSPETFAAVQ